MSDALDNPLWASLATSHRSLAVGDAASGVLRYPGEVAPFLAVERAGARVDDELARLVAPAETVLVIGPRPAVPRGWALEDFGTITQMVAEHGVPEVEGPAVELLRTEASGDIGGSDPDDDRARVLALTALVYPHYFRPRTVELGRYFGIRDGDRLAAIAGERMGFPGHREISAVCTHPDHVGRGLARRVLGVIAGEIRARGEVPFLHVSPANTRAIELYARNGFVTRTAIPFAALARPA